MRPDQIVEYNIFLASLAEMRSWAYLTDLSTKTSFNYEEMAKLSHRFQKQMYIDVYNKFNSFNDRSPEQSAYTLERVEIVNRYYKVYLHYILLC